MDKGIEYSIKDGYNEMDFDKVTEMLAGAYWCEGIQKEEVLKGAQNSALVVGAFSTENKQIGFARVISDKTRFAYILDIIVDEGFKKKGIEQDLTIFILNHPDLKDVYQWLLISKDARDEYKKVGFKTASHTKSWLEIRLGRPEK